MMLRLIAMRGDLFSFNMPPERCRVWASNRPAVQTRAGGCAKPALLISQKHILTTLTSKRHEANPLLSNFLPFLLRSPPRQEGTKQCIVFGRMGFHEDFKMPSRKAESRLHRKRLGQNVAALRARRNPQCCPPSAVLLRRTGYRGRECRMERQKTTPKPRPGSVGQMLRVCRVLW